MRSSAKEHGGLILDDSITRGFYNNVLQTCENSPIKHMHKHQFFIFTQEGHTRLLHREPNGVELHFQITISQL